MNLGSSPGATSRLRTSLLKAHRNCQDSGSDSDVCNPYHILSSKVDKVSGIRSRFHLVTTSTGAITTPGLMSSYPLAVSRVVALAALFSSILAILFSVIAVWSFSRPNLMNKLNEQDIITTTSVVQTQFRPSKTSLTDVQSSAQSLVELANLTRLQSTPLLSVLNEHHPLNALNRSIATTRQPGIAWLMSFPNSGTSFTIHATREATNCTTATNYALEGEIKDKPSVPVFAGPSGNFGPWLELIPFRHTSIPTNLILTKTHCKGFCSGKFCGPDKTILTVRSFMMGCLSGTRAERNSKNVLKNREVIYSASLVKKAIHIFRHPLDNIVARFHLEYDRQRDNQKYTLLYPRNATGFRAWCSKEDENRALLQTRMLDRHLQRQMIKIPCFNDFYRYLQWHNLAFSMSHDMNLPTMVLHYHEYSDNFEMALDKVLRFLELPRVGEGEPFQSGKVYRSYYSTLQKKAIYNFLKEFSSFETWEQLRRYDFELYE